MAEYHDVDPVIKDEHLSFRGKLRDFKKSQCKDNPKVNVRAKGKPSLVSEEEKRDSSRTFQLEAGTYWLTRICFLRSLGLIYSVAFLVALNQNKELIGQNGLLPADKYIERINAHFDGKKWEAFSSVPSILLFVDQTNLDWWLDAVALVGLGLSAMMLIIGSCNMVILSIIWILYHSLVNIGQRWYSFGWESQLLETGFLAIFFCPVLNLARIPRKTPPSWVVIFGYRWLIFRIMLGAGLIKIRGDQCWRDLTCMNYHYQTQPVPNPISYYMHFSPDWFHRFETLTNHFIELVAPFLLFLPRPLCLVGGGLQILFQIILIISGNLSFLNWLTILPSICCFDDKFLSWLLPWSTEKLRLIREVQVDKRATELRNQSWGQLVRKVTNVSLALLLGYLSVPVVKNLLSENQAMNTSFDSLRIVNTYGAFGSITKERNEVIIQGTRNQSIVPDELGGIWEEYEFYCKPGDVNRRPCLISPYHYRLDWLMWFAAFQSYQYNPWIIHLAAKLLVNDEVATSLIAKNPFAGGEPPRYLRGELYNYTFSHFSLFRGGSWWTRKRIGSYFPVVDLRSLERFLSLNGWKVKIS